jgi:hypothetical protein
MFVIRLDFDKPLVTLEYPSDGEPMDENSIPFPDAPTTYYSLGNLQSKPLPFPTKGQAEAIAKRIPGAYVSKE